MSSTYFGEMTALLLEKGGYPTEIRSGMNNAALYEAVKSGQVDLYIDYTSSVYYQTSRSCTR